MPDEALKPDSPTPATSTPRASIPKPKPQAKPKAARLIVTHTKDGAVPVADQAATTTATPAAAHSKLANRRVRAVKPKKV